MAISASKMNHAQSHTITYAIDFDFLLNNKLYQSLYRSENKVYVETKSGYFEVNS